MKLITRDETSWKFLLIVIAAAIIFGGGVFWYSTEEWPSYQPPIVPSMVREKICWTFVFTHQGIPLPDNQVNQICDEIKPIIISWLGREFNKYQKIKPIDIIKCLKDQVSLSGELLEGRLIWGEGQTFRNPINDTEVIKYLENNNPSLVNEKYVTVFHYVTPTNLQIVNYEYSKKYDFTFITSFDLPQGGVAFVPPVNGISLVHEFMHKLGVSDKYAIVPGIDCLINPATGERYDGYDIMCHRVGGFNPPLSELIISIPTMDEIKEHLKK